MRGVQLVAVASLAGVAFTLPAAQAPALTCPAGKQAKAPIVFDAIALAGKTTSDGYLVSPARFEVRKRVRGKAAPKVGRVVRVATAYTLGPNGVIGVLPGGLDPRPGERWRIATSKPHDGVYSAGGCDRGSRLLD